VARPAGRLARGGRGGEAQLPHDRAETHRRNSRLKHGKNAPPKVAPAGRCTRSGLSLKKGRLRAFGYGRASM
jgi:hypothetical protein